MNEAKCKQVCGKQSDETFFLLTTSLNSLSSSPVISVPSSNGIHIDTSDNHEQQQQHQQQQAQYKAHTNNSSLRISCPTTTTTMTTSNSTIVRTCCYKHHRQLTARHTNDGEIRVDTVKKLLLAVPLQRERKRVVYNKEFFDAIGVEQRQDGNNIELNLVDGHHLIISHYSCVESCCRMSQAKDRQSTRAASVDANMISSHPICVSSLNVDSKDSGKTRSTTNLDEGCSTNISPYSSSGEDDELKKHEKVERSSSSDSALGLDDEILAGIGDLAVKNQRRRNTLTVTDYIPLRPALLPVAEPTLLDDTPFDPSQIEKQLTGNSNQPAIVVPSKMLLEARIVEIPTAQSLIPGDAAHVLHSRRESTVSDAGANEEHRMRIVRTPSVVVSDYSDDVLCGITMEELEFFRKQRKFSLGAALDHCSSPHSSATENTVDTDYNSDLSAASSFSNLDCCGSTISGLDDNYGSYSGLGTPERKLSNCSTCSSLEDCSDGNLISSTLIEALNQQQRKKKVCTCSIRQARAVRPSGDSNECV